jgi:hypothetical protein
MNAYELAGILRQSDFLAMDFAEDAANMLIQQADRIAELEEQLAKWQKFSDEHIPHLDLDKKAYEVVFGKDEK